MKRLILFGAIFGAGLLLLVLLLGPGQIVVTSDDPEIQPSDLSDVSSVVVMNDGGAHGSRIGIGLEGAGRIPLWKELLLPDGSKQQVKSAEIAYQGNEPFRGGLHLSAPRFELFAGRKPDEKPHTVLTAGGGDLALRGDPGSAAGTPQQLDVNSVKAWTLSPDVVVESFDEAGRPTQRLATERLEGPEAPLDADGKADLFPSVIAPGPIHLQQLDGSLDLRAGGLDLQRRANKLTLAPPIAITTSGVTLPDPAAPRATKPAPAAPAATDSAPREPIHITCDGPATFVGEEKSAPAGSVAPAAPPAAGATAIDTSSGLDDVIGPGELIFHDNVVVKQGDRSLRTSRLRAKIARGADGLLSIEELDAGVPGKPLYLGLLGGEGTAALLHWSQRDQGLVLDGPIRFDDLRFGEGADEKKLDLVAKRRAIVRELAAAAPLPARVELTLEEEAHLEATGEMTADGATIVVTLVLPKEGGDAAGAKLLSVAIEGGGATPLATAELTGQGKARARSLRLGDDDRGGRTIHLAGDARAEFEEGWVEGDTLDLTLPADPKLPTDPKPQATVIVPRLTAAEFDLPAGDSPFEPRFDPGARAAAPQPAAPPPPRRLAIEPLQPCALQRVGKKTDFTGRATYHVRADGKELQTLIADELHLAPDGDGSLHADAIGTVDLVDAARGLHLRAARMHTAQREVDGKPMRLLLVDGERAPDAAKAGAPQPAWLTLALPELGGIPFDLFAPALELDLDRGALHASGLTSRPRLLVPEPLLERFMPALAAKAAAPTDATAPVAPAATDVPAAPPVEFLCEELRFIPDPKDRRLDHGTLQLERNVFVSRPRDGASLNATRLVLDLAVQSGLVDGSAGAPVVARRPKPYDAQRLESLTTAWLRVERGGDRIRAADDSIVVLHPEELPTADAPLPPLRRLELRTSDGPELNGDKLMLTGGVELDLDYATRERDGTTSTKRASARGDRALLLLAHPLKLGGFAAQLLTLQQHVRFDFGGYHATGATLLYRFPDALDGSPHPGWFTLREGIELGELRAEDALGRWRVGSLFREMRAHPPTSKEPDESVEFDGLRTVVESKVLQKELQ
jgi:hypothetical protein